MPHSAHTEKLPRLHVFYDLGIIPCQTGGEVGCGRVPIVQVDIINLILFSGFTFSISPVFFERLHLLRNGLGVFGFLDDRVDILRATPAPGHNTHKK